IRNSQENYLPQLQFSRKNISLIYYVFIKNLHSPILTLLLPVNFRRKPYYTQRRAGRPRSSPSPLRGKLMWYNEASYPRSSPFAAALEYDLFHWDCAG
ncbi:MAG: hypothetical protein LBQ66_14425, partial [Planctomycetaceae bacterium]|nr:hypothetical protein [Planctomycetaceae bacterium]